MKKGLITIFIILIGLLAFYLSFGYRNNSEPIPLYQVYLNDEVLGVIKSKSKLEKYIDKKNDEFKEKYGVKKVYAPNGLEIKKITTYNSNIDSIANIYSKISQKGEFTIKGYQYNIKKGDKINTIYVTKKSIFKNSINKTIKTFIGEEAYNAYLDKTQSDIVTTGSLIENVYVDEDITIKKVNIPVTEKIYTNEEDLSKYLLFGTTEKQNVYVVQDGDTIADVAFNHQISVEEFLISNPTFTSAKNLLFPGQQVVIGVTDPQISVVSENYVVEDVVSKYSTDVKYDADKLQGEEEVLQAGEDGLERVTQNVKYVNGVISYVDTVSKEELKPTISEVVIRGEKVVSGVGSTSNWLWPTNSGWRISSDYVYRINPVSGGRELHAALDISGTGYGSPIYAVTNGVVSEASSRSQDGNYVCINHNNGYYTCYAHMQKRNATVGQTVARGDVIGYVGSSGWATGPHVHFEIWIGKPWSGGHRINPWTMYPNY